MDRLVSLREMVAADPEDGLARYMLGRELLARKSAVEAAEHLAEAARLTPDHTATWRELGNALAAAGQVNAARVAYERGIETSERTGDLQTGREIRVFLNRLNSSG